MTCEPSIENYNAAAQASHYEPQGAAGDEFDDWMLSMPKEVEIVWRALEDFGAKNMYAAWQAWQAAEANDRL